SLEDRVRAEIRAREESIRATAKGAAEHLRLQGKQEEAAQRLNAVEAEILADRQANEGLIRQQIAETDASDEEFLQERVRRQKADTEATRAASAARRQALRDEADEARSTLRVYDTLRRDGNTGLLYGSESDGAAAREIQR